MRTFAGFALFLAFAGCGFGQTVELPEEPGLYAVLETSQGTIVALLYDDKAPETVKNFVALARGTKQTLDKTGKLVKRPYYNGLTFHRVIKGFMIQTGDTKGTGSTPCGVPNLKDEIDKVLSFDSPGRLGMANTGRPNTASCQFFITVGRASYLDGKYTIFGQVMVGQDVAEKISTMPTTPGDHPLVPIVLKTVTIQRKDPVKP